MAGSSISLALVNKSEDSNNSDVVIATKNIAPGFEHVLFAWRVVRNLGRGDTHPFQYPIANEVAARDSWGNVTPQFKAEPGEAFDLVKNDSGDVLQRSQEPSQNPSEIVLRNKLEKGAVDALSYKDGQVAATVTNLEPGENGAFEFHPEIFVGVVSDVKEGEPLSGAAREAVHTQIDLLGIASSDLVWSGGGDGPDANPFEFTLRNVVYT